MTYFHINLDPRGKTASSYTCDYDGVFLLWFGSLFCFVFAERATHVFREEQKEITLQNRTPTGHMTYRCNNIRCIFVSAGEVKSFPRSLSVREASSATLHL